MSPQPRDPRSPRDRAADARRARGATGRGQTPPREGRPPRSLDGDREAPRRQPQARRPVDRERGDRQPLQRDPLRPVPSRRSAARDAAASARSERTGASRTGSARTGSARTGSAPRTGSPRAASGRPAPERAGRARAEGTGRPRPGNGTARRGPRRPPVRRPLTAALGDPGHRLKIVLLGATMVISLFAARLLQVQALDGPAYASTAERQRTTTVTLPASRGSILDRNGVELATSVDTVTVTTDQTQVSDPARYAQLLAPLLGKDAAGLQRDLTGSKHYKVLAKKVSPATWKQIKELTLDGKAVTGLYSESSSKRVYADGVVAGNLLGFVGADGKGHEGLEYRYQRELAGRDGHTTYERSPGGRKIPTALSSGTTPVAGDDVQLTIDRDIQWVAQKAIAAKVKEADASAGYVVVMNPKTGEILAMASSPSVDPNDPGKTASAADRRNRAVSDVYEPGSTSKVMTAAAAIEEGAVTPSTVFTVPDHLKRAGKVFHDHDPHPVEHLTFAGVLAKSSNVGTIQAYERLGASKLYSYMRKFGIGSPTGLNFPGETPGLLRAPDDWSKTTGYTMSFGQGVSVNAVQQTSVFATIANHGVRVSPVLVKGYRAADGTWTASPHPAVTRVVSPVTAHKVSDMLEAVVGAEGTAPEAQLKGYRVAGKTGTAQRYDETCGCYRGFTASFIGFAPADNPALVVSVTLQDPKNGHFGGVLGGPVFKEVMSFGLQTLKVAPTGTKPPTVQVSVP